MKRSHLLIMILVATGPTLIAQNAVDALRYSRLNPGGTARFMGLSGAFGALGADFTVASANPAGLGLYKSSEFSFTPSVFIGRTASTYNGMTGDDQRSNFALGNVGVVLTSKIRSAPNKAGWKYVQFATGLNRLADYNNRAYITGPNHDNSLLDTYVEYANGIPFKQIEDDTYGDYAFDLNPAWWTYLLDLRDPNIDEDYINPIPHAGVMQQKTIDTKGSMNEYIFSIGANYNDRLYLGATIGIPFFRYSESAVYSEYDQADTINDFKQFDKIDELETHGNGFDFKFGFIYRVNEWFRFGGAFHTPTWFTNINDSWSTTMQSQFDNGDRYSQSSPTGNYEYDLTTPLRAQGSVGFIIGNVGLVSAEYEFTDYSMARLSASDYDFNEENDAVKNSYVIAHHMRIGTEWRYNIFSFRGGFQYETSPYKSGINDGQRFGFSLGTGLRLDWFFFDIAYAYSNLKEDYYLYSSNTVFTNPVNNTLAGHSILTTFGVKF